jgi:aldose 1-epimerase
MADDNTKGLIMGQVQQIENGYWQVGLLPETGASVAYGRIKRDNRWLDFMRPTPDSAYKTPSSCSSFILIPWSNRIRDGLLTFQGKSYQLRTASDGTARHGVGRDYPWQVVSADATQITLTFQSWDHADANFPFRFSGQVIYRVDKRRFSITLALKNEDSQPMPGGLGNHPYFQRALDGSADTISLQLPYSRYFELENSLATGPSQPIPSRLNFQQLRPLGTDIVDDVLTGQLDNQPIRFVYQESGQEILLHVDPIFEQVVFYAPAEKDFFAVEPVSNTNDGFNLYEKGIPGTGVFVLEPGAVKQGTITFEIVE